MRKAVVSLFALLAFAACVGTDPAPSSSTSLPDGGTTAPTGDGGNGTSDASTSDASSPSDAGDGGDASDGPACIAPSTPARVLFLAKGGGTYTVGAEDSRTNKSSIVDQDYTVTAWSVAQGVWSSIIDCVKGKLAPFNVTVTDVDPGTAEHVEVVFAQAGFFTTYAPSSPSIGPSTCGVVPNAVAFVSQPHAETSPANGCAASAQLYGVALGLEFVSACPDAMSYSYTSCNDAPFSKTAVACGTSTAANCSCGPGATQTSFDRMLAVLGPRCL